MPKTMGFLISLSPGAFSFLGTCVMSQVSFHSGHMPATKRQVLLRMGGATVWLTPTICPDSLNRRLAVEYCINKGLFACDPTNRMRDYTFLSCCRLSVFICEQKLLKHFFVRLNPPFPSPDLPMIVLFPRANMYTQRNIPTSLLQH